MKRADEAVEKVLSGMRGAEADPGLEERLMRRVRSEVRDRQARSWFGRWQWVAGGCVAMALVGVGLSLRRHENLGDVAIAVRVRAVPRDIGPVRESEFPRPRSMTELRDGRSEIVISKKAGSLSRANGSRDLSSSEITEVSGVGFPAPPLPLTAEERLLLRAVADGDPQPAAVFEPSMLPTHDAEETAEFVEFFGQDQSVVQSTTGESR